MIFSSSKSSIIMITIITITVIIARNIYIYIWFNVVCLLNRNRFWIVNIVYADKFEREGRGEKEIWIVKWSPPISLLTLIERSIQRKKSDRFAFTLIVYTHWIHRAPFFFQYIFIFAVCTFAPIWYDLTLNNANKPDSISCFLRWRRWCCYCCGDYHRSAACCSL